MKRIVFFVFGVPKDGPSLAASQLAECDHGQTDCYRQIAVAPFSTMSPHLKLVIIISFLQLFGLLLL